MPRNTFCPNSNAISRLKAQEFRTRAACGRLGFRGVLSGFEALAFWDRPCLCSQRRFFDPGIQLAKAVPEEFPYRGAHSASCRRVGGNPRVILKS